MSGTDRHFEPCNSPWEALLKPEVSILSIISIIIITAVIITVTITIVTIISVIIMKLTISNGWCSCQFDLWPYAGVDTVWAAPQHCRPGESCSRYAARGMHRLTNVACTRFTRSH